MTRKPLLLAIFLLFLLLAAFPAVGAIGDEGRQPAPAAFVLATEAKTPPVPAATEQPARANPTPSLIIPTTAVVLPSPTPIPPTETTEPTITAQAEAEQPAAETPTADPQILVTGSEDSAPALDPENWKEWPVLPAGVTEDLRETYYQGLERGNNPHAFSILGDCQSLPEVFMGGYDSDEALVSQLPEPLQETVGQFSGSFNRYSPTVKDGTTEGALLWDRWNDNKEKLCNPGESPLDCELRVHQPSIVFIHVGTHWEARNRRYLTIIIEKILEHGAVPVLVTKADNLELDERVNQTLASLASEYRLPLWNFWASVQHLPNNGMATEMYLSQEGLEVHRLGGLEALDVIWRALQ